MIGMFKSSLYVAIALACAPMSLWGQRVESDVFGTPAFNSLPVGVHDQTGTVKLSSLPDLLGRGIESAAIKLAGESPQMTMSRGEDMGWVGVKALSDASVRQQAMAFFQSGVPVLVLGAPAHQDEHDAIASVFGASSRAAIAVYVRGVGGGLEIFSMDAPMVGQDAGLRVPLQQLVSDVESLIGSDHHPTHSAPSAHRLADDTGEAHALPRMNVKDTQYAASGNGSSVTLDATVLRDSSTSKDVFTVIAHSKYNLKPHDNGLSDGRLTVPYRYTMKQSIIVNSSNAAVSLAEQFPKSDQRTDIQISETKTTTTSYGFNISREISGGLQGKVPEASAKLSFGFNFGREYTDSKTVALSIKDYFLLSSAAPNPPGKHTAEWIMELASAIYGDKEYFGKSPSITRVTPTMRGAAPETLAVWELDASYQGLISLDAQSVIQNAKYNGRSSPELTPDPRLQAVASIVIPADSPYLTRETSVFIRSEKGNGGCLWDANSEVVLRQCPDTNRDNFVEQKHAQWYLDTEGRYFNRGSGKCMQMLPSGLSNGANQVITARCSLDNAQRWEWRADRIYSLYNGAADDWRLHVSSGGQVDVRISDKNLYQDVPKNPFHDLLIPWSNYPSKPVAGVFVPVLDGARPPIPDDWLRFNAVGPDQTWKITVLRQSLIQR